MGRDLSVSMVTTECDVLSPRGRGASVNSVQSGISSILFDSNETDRSWDLGGVDTNDTTVTSLEGDDDEDGQGKGRFLRQDYCGKFQFLQFVDPFPVHPPKYGEVNPGRRVRFPVFEGAASLAGNQPPEYTPAVRQWAVVSLRVEFESPAMPCVAFQNKIWRNFIMEINSTQLNLYHIDPKLTEFIDGYSPGLAPNNVFSPRRQAHSLLPHEYVLLREKIEQGLDTYLDSAFLYRSFSLQFAKVGLPLDFQWREHLDHVNDGRLVELSDVPDEKTMIKMLRQEDFKHLRMRVEGQQFLVKFEDVDTMLAWNVFLDMGINVSLDLEIREFPLYRIVPRRSGRRARRDRSSVRRTKNKPHSHTQTVTVVDECDQNKVVSKLKQFFLGSAPVPTHRRGFVPQPPETRSDGTTPSKSSRSLSSSAASQHERNNEEEEEDDDDDDDDDDDTRNDEDEEMEMENEDNDDEPFGSDVSANFDVKGKWDPLKTTLTRERYLIHSLRCIKPFYQRKSWNDRVVVREAPAPDYQTNNLPIFYDSNTETYAVDSLMMPKSKKVSYNVQNHYVETFLLEKTTKMTPCYDLLVKSWDGSIC
ncbi:uncharacterized protein KNAG_0F01540 [Huiozyma naganishii CBS 8797]|uniref:Uncharacterized protein n=1 Tax=Huiozyma naganishii (strain ATCC MYA-139 / BCRC 22969 / CBS 8797 / KCTC 17520 / NBRC 10181 / NCYC 3082 / Yp74L-3) TaxID=1071383 RepID=J7RZY7_HUIN7|nr:hypothetical protein KNAG_0F01540 [Kazachstania naganishii CBS 8797]CCK70822.1 hypothetical protein KNAG_0F01540 [Kazachstania naganishii CBS 8797]